MPSPHASQRLSQCPIQEADQAAPPGLASAMPSAGSFAAGEGGIQARAIAPGRPNAKRRPRSKVKRAMDIFLCLMGMPLLMPLGLLLALCVCLDSRGAPIYRQERLGKGGKPFMLYKFRTMVKGADQRLAACLEADPELAREWAENQKLKDDPRLTRAGRFLRKTSLDELPQIINILLGDMSLVGPRPIVADERPRYGRHFQEYCEARPGLTGLWQTSGRNNTTYAQRVAYDHYYLNNWSIWLDLRILAKTIPVALSAHGAY